MIIKSFELNKIKINTANLILFYGKNDGEKNQYFKSLKKEDKEIYNYEEKDDKSGEPSESENFKHPRDLDPKNIV